jgi:phosphoribosyl 1,2-cyclic phosphodiesterase
VRLTVCGVRGSIPVAGPSTVEFGGNTSCVGVALDDAPITLVLDAGTGIRRLPHYLDGAPFRGAIVLGHLHWDHMIGIPFCPSIDHPDAEVRMLVPEQGEPAIELLAHAMSPPAFPIRPEMLRGDWSFEGYGEGTFELAGFEVTTREIPHSAGRTMGIRVSDGRSSIAYLSDHAPHLLGPGPEGVGEHHEAAMALASGVDLLIHDAQYTAEELPAKALFGHSAADYPVHLAEAAGAKAVLLYHHDPSRDDVAVGELEKRMRDLTSLRIDAAREGVVIHL